MKYMRPFLLFITMLVVPQLRAASGGAMESNTVTSAISEVTVYADRARVTRTSSTTVRAGATRLTFEKLPGWIDEGSVRVSVEPSSAAEIADVQIEKTFLAKADNDDVIKAEAAVLQIADQLAALDDEKRVLDAQSNQVDSIRVFSLDKMPRDAALREIKPEEFNGVVKFVGDNMLQIARAKRELEKKRRELQPELNARQRKLNDLRQSAQLEQRSVVVTMKGSRDASVKVSLTYMLPGTTWEPVHELRTAQDGKSVSFASYAVVTQTTGEDWEGVPVTFSTQRPNATARIPELEALLLGNTRTVPQVINASADTFQIAAGNFDRQNVVYNVLANGGRADVQQDWDNNVREQRGRQARVVEVFQKVLQRGTTAQFPATGAQTVRSDGRPVRVPIGSRQLAATPRIVAAPEVSLNAAQTAELVNTASQPLLPGKVLLYSEGAFVGTTEMEFAAAGESFSMFLGVADQIKLSRTLDQKRSSLTWSGKRKRMLASFVVVAENLSDKPVTFQLAERIPVSETDEVRVIGVKVQPDLKPDNNGLIKWDAKVLAKEKVEFRIEYTLDYPAELPQRPAASSAAPASSSERLYRQIDSLEKSLKK